MMPDIYIMATCAVIVCVCALLLNRDRCRSVTDLLVLVMISALCVELAHAIPLIGDYILCLLGQY